ncbi:MAG: hypothetical protein KIS87_03240 [Phycisphaeraceae bacterium]|nr:hypothetical protein [Phycisphaeraceae bacterium]
MARTWWLTAVVTAAHASSALGQAHLASPVKAVPRQAALPFVAAEVDLGGLDAIRRGPVVLEGFPLPGGPVDLRVEPFSVLTPDAELVVSTGSGEQPMPVPDVVLMRGTVEGSPGSRVFLSLSEWGSHGLILADGRRFALVAPPFGIGGPHVVYNTADLPDHLQPSWVCRVNAAEHDVLGLARAATGSEGEGLRSAPCRIATVAVDSDYEYTAWLFGANPDASAAYALTLMAAVSEIYTYELNVRLMVPYLRVFAQNNDPYGGGDRLGELLNHWRATKGNVQRDLVHLFSGDFGGGVAYVSVTCSKDWGYAVSGLGGWFPYPLQDHHGGNWDLMVVAHELGHNFGTLHTHDGYNPPIDGCGLGDCSQAWGGTIMSYCHTCPGGMTNIVLRFGERVIDRVLHYLQFEAPCNLTNRLYGMDDHAVACRDTPLIIDLLANDTAVNCDGIVLAFLPGVSRQGGTITLSPGTGPGGRDEAVYLPPAGFAGVDDFEYVIHRPGVGYATAVVSISVVTPRPSDAIGITAPGVSVAYYATTGGSSMPDFAGMTPYKLDVLPKIDFPSTNGNFATSNRSDHVGAVFQGLFFAPQTAVYTLSVESDDGSMLYLGNDLLINNDGLHGMIERSASIALEAGPHRLRVDFFENTGGAGLIVRVDGPGLPRQPIPASRWRHDDCVPDWFRDGIVNSYDFILYLTDWNLKDPRTDLNGDGTVGTLDFLQFLNAFVAGCP